MATGSITLNVVNGRRQPFPDKTRLLITARDGMQKTVIRDFKDADGGRPFELTGLEIRDNFADQYTVLVSTKDHADGGFTPVRINAAAPEPLDLMLVPRNQDFVFDAFDTLTPDFVALLDGETPGGGRAVYERLAGSTASKPALACLCNITTALAQMILVPDNVLDQNPLKAFKRLDRDPAQDRCFAWADARLLPQIAKTKDAKGANGVSHIASAPAGLHKGASISFKQTDFGEANVQLSFHESDPPPITVNGVKCVLVDVDIDYFKDTGAHLLGEVFPNKLKKLIFGKESSHALTDPRTVYGLRWTNGRRLGREFAPPYVIG
jgi:hypothetical protein